MCYEGYEKQLEKSIMNEKKSIQIDLIFEVSRPKRTLKDIDIK
jgi:hypothetical protein